MSGSNETTAADTSYGGATSQVIRDNIIFYGIIMFVCYCLHDYLRRHYKLAYATRLRSTVTRNHIVETSYNCFFSWIPSVLYIPDDIVMEYAGLDSMLFLRFQRLCIKVALLSVSTSIFLLPIYKTGDKNLTDFLSSFTVQNVSSSSEGALVAAVFALYVIALGTMFLLRQEYLVFITRRHEFLSKSNAPQYTVLVDNIPSSLLSTDSMKKYVASAFSQNVLHSVEFALEIKSLEEVVARRKKVVKRLESDISHHKKIEKLSNELDELNFEISDMIKSIEGSEKQMQGIVRSSAFVSFKSLKAAHVAQQALQSAVPSVMTVSQAPNVEDVCWKNVGISKIQKDSWQLVSLLNTCLIIFLFVFVTTFIALMSNIEKLEEKYPDVATFLKNHEFLKDAMPRLAPLLLVLANVFVKILFQILASKEGHNSHSEIEASVFSKLAIFKIVHVFFITTISGSILPMIKDITKKPELLPKLLANEIPGRASFYMSYVVIQFTLLQSAELLRVVPLIMNFLHQRVLPSHWDFIKPLSCPGTLEEPSTLTNHYVVILLLVVYSPIAPAFAIFGLVYFVTSEVVYRRQIFFIYDGRINSSGVYWPIIYKFMIRALWIGQLTFFGIIITKGYLAGLVIGLAIVTIVFDRHMSENMPRTAAYLPLSDCLELDQQRRRWPDMAWNFLSGAYRQDALKEKDPVFPSNGEVALAEELESASVASADDNGSLTKSLLTTS